MSEKARTAVIVGKRFALRPTQVERDLRDDVLPEPLKEHFVIVNHRRYPPKQVMEVVTGWIAPSSRRTTLGGFSPASAFQPVGAQPGRAATPMSSTATPIRPSRLAPHDDAWQSPCAPAQIPSSRSSGSRSPQADRRCWSRRRMRALLSAGSPSMASGRTACSAYRASSSKLADLRPCETRLPVSSRIGGSRAARR